MYLIALVYYGTSIVGPTTQGNSVRTSVARTPCERVAITCGTSHVKEDKIGANNPLDLLPESYDPRLRLY
jgi:hypothetical protein